MWGDALFINNCPFLYATAFSLQQPSPFCHPERSRGICSSADLSWKCFSTGNPEAAEWRDLRFLWGVLTHTQKRQNSRSLHAVAGFVAADEVGVLRWLGVALNRDRGHRIVGRGLRQTGEFGLEFILGELYFGVGL